MAHAIDAALLEQLYLAASGCVDWNAFLSRAEQHLDASIAGLMVHDSHYREYSMTHHIGAPEVQLEYADHFGKYDIHFQAAIAAHGKLKAGMVQLSQDVIPVSQLTRTYYYNDFLRKHDILHQCGAIIADSGDRVSAITFGRPHGAQAFDEDARRFLHDLSPHLQAAFSLQRHLIDLRLSERSLQAAFDASDKIALVVNTHLKILAINKCAKRYIDGSTLLAVVAGKLNIQSPAQAEQLKASVRLCVSKNVPTRHLLVQRSSGSDINLSITPLPSESGLVPGDRAALIVVEDSLHRKRGAIEVFRATYDFTPAENRIALLLLEGKDLREIAADLHLTRNTLKTHLRHMFQKTGARRQTELVCMLIGHTG